MYNKFKTWTKEHKTQLIYALSFVIVFFAGFGSGRVESNYRKTDASKPEQGNYTTLPPPIAPPNNTPPQEATKPLVQGTEGYTGQTGECIIKGNISGKNKIYHVKGGAFYDRTQAEVCFKTPTEAEAAGFRKSSR